MSWRIVEKLLVRALVAALLLVVAHMEQRLRAVAVECLGPAEAAEVLSSS